MLIRKLLFSHLNLKCLQIQLIAELRKDSEVILNLSHFMKKGI